MATATIGIINEFDAKTENFTVWKQRLEHYMKANQVPESLQVSVLISTLGSSTFSILLDLTQPDNPSDKTFSELVALLEAHFQPKKITTAERFKFYNRKQAENESIAEYVAQLKHMAASCDFGTFRSQALRDRLICGLKNTGIQSRLMEANRSFEDTLEMALMLEQIQKETKKLLLVPLAHAEDKTAVHKVQKVASFHKSMIPRYQPKAGTSSDEGNKQQCYRCLANTHEATKCPYKSFKCRNCKRIGHLAKACKTKTNHAIKSVDNKPEELMPPGQTTDEKTGLWKLDQKGLPNSYKVTVNIEGKPLEMVLDCGAVVSIIPEELYRSKFPELPLEECPLSLEVYGGKTLPLLGQIKVRVMYGNQNAFLDLVVAKGLNSTVPPLFGRNWLEVFKLDWKELVPKAVQSISESEISEIIKELQEEYPKTFSSSMGEIRDFKVNLVLKPNAIPVFCKSRTVPLALQEKVKIELDRMVENGILLPVRHSDWATPLVIVPKANGEVRICGDFKVTVNPVLETEHYQLPSVEDLFTVVGKGQYFAVLDLSGAYLQLTVDKPSQELLTVNTPYGLFQFTRLCYGIKTAPMLFQSVMDRVLLGIANTMCYLDDILICGETKQECKNKLKQVLDRLESYNIRLRQDKCVFLASQVEYLGHCIDGQGIRPTKAKCQAIYDAPAPKNVTDLKAYLGLLNYYGKFIPQLSSQLHPLYQLLKKDVPWTWTAECAQVFENSKMWLTDKSILTPYDPRLPIRLACDASGTGVGAVLSHILDDGSEKPIFYASKTLSDTEKGYANIEREALAIVYAVRKFHKYLYGRKFQLVTDHKPLTAMFHPTRGVPQMAAARMQRWALLLSAYDYDIVYKKGTENMNADALSRLPCPENETVESTIFYFSPIRDVPMDVQELEQETTKDPVLSQAWAYTKNGWPAAISSEALQPYFSRREELSIQDGCLLWGNRVVVPNTLREAVTELLHEAHPGITKMKMIARSLCWWPKIDQDLENVVQRCNTCQQTRNAEPVVTYAWPSVTKTWERVHVDLATKDKVNILIITDAYSKWVEAFLLPSTDTAHVIERLRTSFAAYGLPEKVVTDNGPQLVSAEFKEFLKKNGVAHVTIPVYHPASNGLVERSIQTLKKNLMKQVLDEATSVPERNMQHRLDNFLFAYRSTPHSGTKLSPAELFLKRKVRTRLEMLRPGKPAETEKNIVLRTPKYQVGQRVYVRNTYRHRRDVNWIPGVVVKIVSPATYIVKIGRKNRFTHLEHLRDNLT